MQTAEVLRAGQGSAGKTVVVFFGMIASGKSTLGEAWAGRHRAPYHNTDRVRKELAGLRPTDRRPEAAEYASHSRGKTRPTDSVVHSTSARLVVVTAASIRPVVRSGCSCA